MPVKYTAQVWKQYQPALRSYSVSTLEAAHAVLVEGQSLADTARKLNTTRQTVHAAVKRVRARLDEYVDAELVPVLVWVPADQVEAVNGFAREHGGISDNK